MFSLFTYICLLLYRFLYLNFHVVYYGVSDSFMSVLQMELNNYPHFIHAEDGRLYSMGQHCPGSRECYTTHTSILATTGTHRSTVADCPRPMTWTGARLV
jgi:hypothetical protein